jgi:hypothetical protein
MKQEIVPLREIYKAYQSALAEAAREYEADETWHSDMCNCPRCQAFEHWYQLPLWKRWWAKAFY